MIVTPRFLQRLKALDVLEVLGSSRPALHFHEVRQTDERTNDSGRDIESTCPRIDPFEIERRFDEEIDFGGGVLRAEHREHGQSLFPDPQLPFRRICEVLELDRRPGPITKTR